MRNLLLILCLLSFSLTFAQRVTWKKDIQAGEELYEKGSYFNALGHFKKALANKPADKAPENHTLQYKIAECLFNLREYHRAAIFYKKVQDEVSYPLAKFKLAYCVKRGGDYDEAILALNNVRNSYSGQTEILNRIDLELKGATLAKKMIEDSLNVEIEHLGLNINSSTTDFAPKLTDDGTLYFSTMHTSFQEENPDYELNNKRSIANIFKTKKTDFGWKKKKELPETINDQEVHSGNGTFSPDGKTFYFTKCDIVEKLSTRCDIYVSTYSNGIFGEPVKLNDNINPSTASNTQPEIFINEQGKETLIFSSNRTGGKGGFDLYYTETTGTDFGMVYNLESVNTVGNELTPYYNSENQTLYFSTDGLASMGGFDLYEAKGIIPGLSKPKNMGFPINSRMDDMYYFPVKGTNQAYFVSNRPVDKVKRKTFNDDIFVINYSDQTFAAANPVTEIKETKETVSVEEEIKEVAPVVETAKKETVNLLMNVVDQDNTNVQNALITITEKEDIHDKGTTTKKTISSQTSLNLKEGKTYMILVSANNHTSEEFAMSTSGLSSPNITKTVKIQNTKKIADALAVKQAQKQAELARIETEKAETLRIQQQKEETARILAEAEENNSTETIVETETIIETVVDNTTSMEGFSYAIQVASVKDYDLAKYQSISFYGEIHTEAYINGLTRILVGKYKTQQEARRNIYIIRQRGFSDAFLARYKNGQRVN